MRYHDSSGRRQWFEARLEPLMDRLYGTALWLTRHPDDAEDIVAEAVGQAWRHLDTLRDPERFEAWLFHILTNAFISEWRRRRRHPQEATGGADAGGAAHPRRAVPPALPALAGQPRGAVLQPRAAGGAAGGTGCPARALPPGDCAGGGPGL